MHTTSFIAAVASALALPAAAGPSGGSWVLSAVHADFQQQLKLVATAPGAIGEAARTAAGLMAPQNAAQERLVLPLLGWTGAGEGTTLSGQSQALEAGMPALFSGDVALVTALVELYAAAEEAGEPAIARVAERMIWHEVSDVEVLYPAAMLVGATPVVAEPAAYRPGGPFSGPGPFPMMGVGNPHPPATVN